MKYLTKLFNVLGDIFLLKDKDMIPIKRFSENLGEDPRFIVIKSDKVHLIRACRQDAEINITIEVDGNREYISFPKGDNTPIFYEDDKWAKGTPTHFIDID